MSKIYFKKVSNSFFKFTNIAGFSNLANTHLVNLNQLGVTNIAQNRRGQSLVEYMVLVALITAGTIGVVRVVGYNIGIQYENINRSLGAKATNQLQAVSAEQSHLNKKDLSNFLQGSR